MSVTTDRRTNLATCFQRGALSHAAEAYLLCARDKVKRGDPFPVELVTYGVVGRLRSMENYVPTKLAHQASAVRKQLVAVIRQAQKGATTKSLLRALDDTRKSLEKLDSKLQDKCKTVW